MEARVCVGGAGAGAEPTPPTLTHSAPQPGRSVRCLLFLLGAHRPRQPPPPASLLPSPPPRSCGDPPTRLPCPNPALGASRPSRRLPGIQWSGGETRPNVPRGEGRETPSPARGLPPLALPGLSGKRRAAGQRTVISRPEAARLQLPFSPVPGAPSPSVSRGCRGETGPPASWGGMDVEGGHRVSPSPSPLNNERS